MKFEKTKKDGTVEKTEGVFLKDVKYKGIDYKLIRTSDGKKKHMNVKYLTAGANEKPEVKEKAAPAKKAAATPKKKAATKKKK